MHENKGSASTHEDGQSARLKLAEITSGMGALVLGVGIGALFAEWFARDAILIAIIGALLHAFGMWDKHRIESRSIKSPGWVTAAYWVCWLMLAAGAVALLIGRWLPSL